jgi:periplasmic protein TonB
MIALALDSRGLPELPAPSKGIWIAAGLLALSLHLGFAAVAVWRFRADAEDADMGAPAMAIAIDLASPRLTPSQLPPGPDSEASVASPAVPEQKMPVEVAELPRGTAVESERPDRLVTLNDSKPVTEEAREVTPQMVTPTEASVAQEETAMPSVETPVEAAQSVTVDQGTAQSRQRMRVTWQRELAAHLDKHKRYPADRAQQEMQVILAVALDRTGRVVSASVATSSGDTAFDQAAMSMLQRASPVPAPPPLVADEGLNFTLPVQFRRGRKN